MSTTIVASAKPILGVDRHTGAFVALVPSASQPNVYHVTTTDRCDCAGFGFRGRCSHLQPGPRPTRDPGAMFLRAVAR